MQKPREVITVYTKDQIFEAVRDKYSISGHGEARWLSNPLRLEVTEFIGETQDHLECL